MTSLIDVIFLLLLFFMLSSTFTRFSEVDLASAGSGGTTQSTKPVFLTLEPEMLRLNGSEAGFEGLGALMDSHRPDDEALPVLISVRENVTSQRLTDLLAVLRQIPRLTVTVLEAT